MRRLGSHYMIVDSCSGHANIANVYVLNVSAAWLWEQLTDRRFEASDLVDLLCSHYDVTPDRAAADVGRLLSIWSKYNLIIPS